jgi:hypothetical protein
MPEFGVLDGVEWQQRQENGNRYGASFGFLPEPDGEQQTGHDLQVAGWYRWVYDDSEHLSLTGGFQKTLHDGTSNRDLFIAKMHWVPADGWTLRGSTWVDYYDSRDDLKDSGLGLTRSLLSLTRRWEGNRGVDLRFRHDSFPETEREVSGGPILAELADDRVERVSMSAWRPAGKDSLLRAEVGAWVDEEDRGGDVELGIEVDDWYLERSRTSLALFAARGSFTTLAGVRVVYGREIGRGRWDLLYELAGHHLDGFADERDDLLQNRLRGSRVFDLAGGWRFSPYVEADYWDEELAWSLGFWLQRRF